MPDLKLILMVWEVFTLCVSLLCYFVSSCTFFFHPVVTQTDRRSYTRISSDTLNRASHSGSSGWVSTSCIKFSFWYQPAQSGAPAMKLSCCFIQTDSSAPNRVCLQSRCNPTLKLANFPDSQNRITSPNGFLHPALFSSPLLPNSAPLHVCQYFFILSSSPQSSVFPLPPSSPFTFPPLLWPLAKAPGIHSVVVMAVDCGIPAAVLMILPAGTDQPEKYSYHFSTEWELSPGQRLCEICVNLDMRVHKHLNLF